MYEKFWLSHESRTCEVIREFVTERERGRSKVKSHKSKDKDQRSISVIKTACSVVEDIKPSTHNIKAEKMSETNPHSVVHSAQMVPPVNGEGKDKDKKKVRTGGLIGYGL